MKKKIKYMIGKSNINIKPSIFGLMSALAKQHNATNFTQGAPDFKTPPWILEKLEYYSSRGKNQYSPIPGMPELKQACANKVKHLYGCSINPDKEIMISCGASESIYSIIAAFISAGDEVIYFDPAFDAYPNVTKMMNGKSIRLQFLSNGRIDVEAIRKSITHRTKLIILNSPHNPLGTVISKNEYLEIAKIIKNKDILLLSDEVYEHIYAGEQYQSVLNIPELRNQSIVVQSLGKTYNITGWRLGVCIAPEKILPYLLGVKQFTTFSAPTPLQLAVADGINNHPEYYETLPQLYQKSHDVITTVLKNSRFKILPWHGSPFLMLDYSNITSKNDEIFAKELITNHGVGTVPVSSLYEKPIHRYLRVCFAKQEKDLIEGALKLCQI